MLGVIIPAYKRKDCLRGTLTSLTLQTKKSFYVVVVDDHSPEPLKDVVLEFKNKLHIKYIYLEENGGPGVARQVGLNYCYDKHLDFVVFLDSDDYLCPQALARLHREINLSGADVLSSNIFVETKNMEEKTFPAKNKTFIHGKIYRTEFLKENNIVFPPLRTNEDLAFNLKAMSIAKVELLDETLHIFHRDPDSITRNGENGINLELDYIEAIYDATKFLKEKNCSIYSMMGNIFNCYNSYQRANLLDGEMSAERKQHLRWLLSLSEVQGYLSNIENTNIIIEKTRQLMVLNGKIVEFKQTFLEWIKEFTDESGNN